MAALVSLEPIAHASTWTGNGADDNFQTAANWDVLPTAGAPLTFAGTNRLNPSNNFATDTSFSGITFGPTAGAFTIGGNRIHLNGDINDNDTSPQTMTLGLALDASTTNVNVIPGGSLALGPITFGLANQSANVSTLNINNTASTSGLAVRTNSATANTIGIASGATFNVTGAVQIGAQPTTATATATVLNLTGAGTLNVNNTGNFNVQTSSGNNNFGQGPTTVDMTGLSNFNFTTTTGTFGVGYLVTRPNATVRLANTSNTITAALLGVANSGVGSGADNAGVGGNLFLGAGSNLLQVNAINIGFVKATGSIQFQSPSSGSVTITGQAGGASTADITIGQASTASYGGNGQNSLQLAGHTANVQAGTVTVAQLNGSTGGQALNSTLTFDTGTFSVNTLQLALDTNGSAAGGATGTFVMGGPTADSAATGVLNVATNFFLANRSNAVGGSANGTFVLNGGTANINCNITDNSTTGARNTTLTLAGGTLNMNARNIGSDASPITTVNLTSGTITNAARVSGTTINIGSAVNLSAGTTYVVAAGGTLNSSKPTLTLGSGGGVSGGSTASQATVNGDVTAASGSRVTPGVGLAAGTLRFNNNLSLDGGSTARFKLSENVGSGNDRVSVGGNLTAGGAVSIEIGSVGAGAQVGNTYTLFDYSGTLTGNETNFAVAGFGSRQTFTIVPTATTPGQVNVSVGGTPALNLTWTGNLNSTWNLQGDPNWYDPSLTGQQFFNADTVTFDDTSTNLNDVTVVGQLTPGSVTVHASRNYKFIGGDGITGGTGVTKNGSGTLVVAQNNSYTGLTDVQAGTLQVGDGGTSGTLGSGSVNVGSTLVLNRSDAFTFSNPITGGGTFRKAGSGTVMLPAANTFTGQTFIDAGAIRVASFGALGTGTAAATVAAGAQLDIGGLAGENIANGFGARQFFIAGAGPDGSGALVNKGGPQQFNAFQQVILTADATVGGSNTGPTTTGRFDLRNNTPQLDLAGFNLTKTGNNQFDLVGVNVTDGNIVVNNGTFGIETTTSIPDNATGKTITYNAGPGATTTAWFFNFSGNVTRPMVFNNTGGTIIIANASPQVSTVGSNMTLNGPVTFTAVNNGTGALVLNGNITGGSGSVTKDGPIAVSFSGNVNYSGPTNIAAGTLAFNGTGASTIGNVTGVGAATMLKQNTGSLTVNHVRVGNLDIRGGQVIVAASGGVAAGTSVAPNLTVAAGAKLDLTDNKLITNNPLGGEAGGIYGGVQGLVQSASNGGAWDGPGLTTSLPDAVNGLTSIGVATGEQILGLGPTDTALFAGQTITGASAVAMYTYAGDANLDGFISGDDYASIDGNVSTSGADGWYNGDFNYDGIVSGDDYAFIDGNIVAQGAPFPQAAWAKPLRRWAPSPPSPSRRRSPCSSFAASRVSAAAAEERHARSVDDPRCCALSPGATFATLARVAPIFLLQLRTLRDAEEIDRDVVVAGDDAVVVGFALIPAERHAQSGQVGTSGLEVGCTSRRTVRN